MTPHVKHAYNIESIINKSSVLVVVWQPWGEWRIEYMSDGVTQLGYQANDFLQGKLGFKDVVNANHVAEIEKLIKEGQRPIKLSRRVEVICQDGSKRWVEAAIDEVEMTDPSNYRLQAVLVDVTKQVALERVADDYAKFPRENPNPILRIDKAGDILLANDAAQELISNLMSASDEDQQSWRKFVKLTRCEKRLIHRRLEVGKEVFEFSVVPIQESDYVNLYGVNITDRLVEEQVLSDVVDNLPGAVFQYERDSEGVDSISFFGKGSEKLWEMSSAELNRDPTALWQSIWPQDVASMVTSVDKSANNLSLWAHEWRIKTLKSQTNKWLRGQGVPRTKKGGGVVWTSIVLDATAEKQASEALSQALTKTVQVLSAALEVRDPYTAGHEERVAKISVLIGREMGLDEHTLIGLSLGATVHDIGKIGIPAEILSKPTKLSDIEFSLIKDHPRIGADLLKDVQFEWPIEQMILQHHERCDGSGYPHGLRKNDIIIEARIIAVADTLEAMASHRPYRAGLGLSIALKELEEGAGTRYDQDVVAACMRLIEQEAIQL